eukprot:TRINITY_DN22740_c0_g2_i2.p1 TRINITY_DN22740_c0_g2~~TRINITY_DN22740_c0_g2_i2.p1  ORF type:complete len:295 (+),score=39.06 TRINITY_DN22740_c0_g2_i2:20-904(+)
MGEHDLRYYSIVCFGILSAIGFILVSIVLVSLVSTNKMSKMKFRLVFYLFCTNILQEVSFLSSLAWLDNTATGNDVTCLYQAVLLHFAFLSSGFWNVTIGVYLLLCTKIKIIHYRPGRKFEMASHLIWVVSAVISCIGFMHHNPHEYYGPVSGGTYCWISDVHNLERVVTFLALLDAAALVMGVCYSVLIYSYYSQNSFDRGSRSLISSLVGFPVIYSFCYIPMSIVRFISMYDSSEVPLIWYSVCISLYPLEGIFNSLLYGRSRKIFSCTPQESELALLNENESSSSYSYRNK